MAGKAPRGPSQAIERGLGFLAGQQLATGGFKSLSSASPTDFSGAEPRLTTFIPSLVLSALAAIDTPAAQRIRGPLATYLFGQKHADWSYNYWSSEAPELTAQPYPDDLDDTFCALLALKAHDPASISDADVATIVRLLLATETAVGGPYRTWLVSQDSKAVWLDVDLAVNCNVAGFLKLIQVQIPSLRALIEAAIHTQVLESPYYVPKYPILYYLARAYDGPATPRLRAIAERLQASGAHSPLRAAILLSASCQLTCRRPAELADSLIGSQAADGSWPAEAFYLDPPRNGSVYYHGSPNLTTALALEALERYQLRLARPPAANRPSQPRGRSHHKQVIAGAEKLAQSVGSELRAPLVRMLRAVASSTNGIEITDLAVDFAGAYTPSSPLELPIKQASHQLGMANLFGWVAYSIYDDFLDDEGQPALLSVANVALRLSIDCHMAALPANNRLPAVVRDNYNRIDNANAWELAHCRFVLAGGKLTIGRLPEYGRLEKLAERSLGHTLGPQAILLADPAATPAARRGLESAHQHYLIAKQLNDDLHDWQDDLSRGHVTYVVSQLLSDSAIDQGEHVLADLLPAMKQQFWHTTLPAICHHMRRQVQAARRALRSVPGVSECYLLYRSLDAIETSIDDTLASRQQALSFLEQYQRQLSKATP